MTKYKCGHESDAVIIDDNELSFAAYLEWIETVGWRGDKSECWECWCKKKSEKPLIPISGTGAPTVTATLQEK